MSELLDSHRALPAAFGGLDLLLFDGADADDFFAPPAKVAAYAGQLASLLANAPPHAWLVTHRPVWAMAQGQLSGLTTNLTEQAAIRGHVPPGLDLVLSGHLHDFISYDFGPERPAQLIVGTGGDTLLTARPHPDRPGPRSTAMAVRQGFASERFGYFIMERSAGGGPARSTLPTNSSSPAAGSPGGPSAASRPRRQRREPNLYGLARKPAARLD